MFFWEYKKKPASWNQLRDCYLRNIYFPDTFEWRAIFADLIISKNMLNITQNKHKSSACEEIQRISFEFILLPWTRLLPDTLEDKHIYKFLYIFYPGALIRIPKAITCPANNLVSSNC